MPQSHTPDHRRHSEEKPQNTYSHKTPGRKATRSLFPIKMIAKLENKTKKDQTQNSHGQREQPIFRFDIQHDQGSLCIYVAQRF